MAFVEWPLASNMAQNEELVKLAKSKNVKTIVGLQTRADPLVIKIKQLVRHTMLFRKTQTDVDILL